MSDRDASLDEASNIAFKALKEKPPAKPVDLYYITIFIRKQNINPVIVGNKIEIKVHNLLFVSL